MNNDIKTEILNALKDYKNVNKIYGGTTHKLLNERHKEHKQEEPEKYKGTKIKQLINKKFNKEEIILYEQFLIKQLHIDFKNKVLNIQTGGQGIKDKEIYKLYIIYK